MDYLCSAYHALHPPNEGEFIHPAARRSDPGIIGQQKVADLPISNLYYHCNFPMTPPVRRSVCHASKNGGRLHFHAPIGVLVILISYGHERVVVEWKNTFLIEHPILNLKTGVCNSYVLFF